MKLNNLMDVVKQYETEARYIQSYVPNADIEEIYMVAGLKRFLHAQTERDAYTAIRDTNPYFQRAIGFQMLDLSFDENKLKYLVKNVSIAASKQKLMSNDDLLARMSQYQSLVLKQESEKSKLTWQVQTLTNMTESLLYEGLNSAGITAVKTKDKFKKAIKLMNDNVFKNMESENQVNILHNVIVGGETIETALKREWVNRSRE